MKRAISRAPWLTFVSDLSFTLSCLLLPPIFLAFVFVWFGQPAEGFEVVLFAFRIGLSLLVLLMSWRLWLHYRDPHGVSVAAFPGLPTAQKRRALVTLSFVVLALIGLVIVALGIIYIGFGWLIMSTTAESEGVEYPRHWGEYVPAMVLGGLAAALGTLMVMPLVGRLRLRRPRPLPVSTAVPTTPADVEATVFSAPEEETKEAE